MGLSLGMREQGCIDLHVIVSLPGFYVYFTNW